MSAPTGRAILVDTNLLVLLLVGLVDERQIESFKRTRQYTIEDYRLLSRLLAGFSEILATPHVFTETNNLLGHLHEPRRTAARLALRTLVETAHEEFRPSRELVVHPAFARLGLTDAAILSAQGEGVAVLTDDFDLYVSLEAAGAEVWNFNHIRTGAWGER